MKRKNTKFLWLVLIVDAICSMMMGTETQIMSRGRRIMEFVIEKDISQDTIIQIVEIARDYTKDYFTDNYPEDMKTDMLFQRAVMLKKGSEIVSCIVFTCLDGSAHITMMATKRDFINKGYGKLLMRLFAEYVSELGLNSIELYTYSPESRPVYAATVGFYESVGFMITREHKDLWEIGTTTLKMRKSWRQK